MRIKKNYLKQKADKSLMLRHCFFKALSLILFLVVLYDSFVHKTPLYYICFLLLGAFVGKFFAIAAKVKHSVEKGKLAVDVSPYGIIITLLLLSFLLVWGRHLLNAAHVLWTTDALYLLFIGIYWSRWKSMVRQMDEIIYDWLSKKEDSSDSC